MERLAQFEKSLQTRAASKRTKGRNLNAVFLANLDLIKHGFAQGFARKTVLEVLREEHGVRMSMDTFARLCRAYELGPVKPGKTKGTKEAKREKVEVPRVESKSEEKPSLPSPGRRFRTVDAPDRSALFERAKKGQKE